MMQLFLSHTVVTSSESEMLMSSAFFKVILGNERAGFPLRQDKVFSVSPLVHTEAELHRRIDQSWGEG